MATESAPACCRDHNSCPKRRIIEAVCTGGSNRAISLAAQNFGHGGIEYMASLVDVGVVILCDAYNTRRNLVTLLNVR